MFSLAVDSARAELRSPYTTYLVRSTSASVYITCTARPLSTQTEQAGRLLEVDVKGSLPVLNLSCERVLAVSEDVCTQAPA